MCAYLLYLKNEHPFLREAPAQALQQTVRDLELAYRRASNPKLSTRTPRFKKKDHSQGIRFPQSFKINGAVIYLPKLGWLGFRMSRKIEGIPKNVTVSSDGLSWYVTIQTERAVANPIHPSNTAIGIDVGIARFAALSDGTFVHGSNAFEKYRKELATLNRRMCRKVPFSSNWRKAQRKVRLIYRKIANARSDMLHKASTAISKNHAIVVLEDLRILNMAASAKGTLETPGHHVRAKSGLNRRILDQGWGEFRSQLRYKVAWSGGKLITVSARNTSRTCAACGDVNEANRPEQSVFRCLACGHTCDADTNAAINILRRAGRVRIACGDLPLGGSTKQEAQLSR